MSQERWASARPEDQPQRLLSCGHIHQSSASERSEPSCPVCEAHATRRGPGLSHLASLGDFVPSPALTWDWASCKSCRQLRPSDRSLARILRLRTAPLKPHGRGPPADSFSVWRATTAGCAVYSGAIHLPERGVLLLAGHGAHFHGTTFKGGIVMCAGPQFSGSFQSCTFDSAMLYAVHGAAVTLRDCQLHTLPLGLTLSGDATLATLSRCSFQSCRTCIVAECGATAVAADCRLENTQGGAIVNGAGSHAALERCDLIGGLKCKYGDVGLLVHRGSAMLRCCQVISFGTAIFGMFRTTAIEAVAVRVAKCLHGIKLAGRTAAVMRGCNITCVQQVGAGSTDAVAVVMNAAGVDGGGTRVQLERCAVHGDAASGATIEKGGRLAAALCSFDCGTDVLHCGAYGGSAVLSHCRGTAPQACMVVRSPEGKLRLEGGCFEGGTTACTIDDGARLTAVDCELRSRGVIAAAGVVALYDGACGWLLRCNVHDGVIGVSAAKASAYVTDTVIRDMRADVRSRPPAGESSWMPAFSSTGYLCAGGRVEVRGGTVHRCYSGLQSKECDGGRATVSVLGVVFTDCVVGVLSEEGTTHVTQCEFHGPERDLRSRLKAQIGVRRDADLDRPEAGVAFKGAHVGSRSVRHCVFVGFPAGVYVAAAGVEVAHCEFTMRHDNGVGVLVTAEADVAHCVFSGVNGVDAAGVEVIEDCACAIRKCRFVSMGGNSVFVRERGSLRMLDSVVEGRDTGLLLQKRAEAVVQDCSMSGVDTGICVDGCGVVLTAERVTIESERIGMHLPQASCGPRERPAVVKLTNSKLSGGDTAVNVSDTPAELTLTDCQISRAKTGLLLCGTASARLQDTKVFKCMTGLVVGELLHAGAGACSTCGRSGAAALRGAYQALLQHGGVSPPGARCAHEGTVATLTVTDVEVSRCQHYGLLVNINGYAEAVRLTVRRCQGGVMMFCMGRRSVFSGCKVIACPQSTSEARRVSANIQEVPEEGPIPEIEVTIVDWMF